ncbi:aldehyde ferredoxin oxidoreductase C-terminal domain-containing protein [Desulfosoma caldarium]|uniref:Aldehyde:ferredoxin oxidoreductase n=1 Tax=Desulfosoma caldarium TaxID=610254 RepID=A0A3N1VQ59_9BACT|nr:aldehyde ferredoxin oxidoreductase C-terminal domain-containing protein [Desulfosoma caldarium]ROR03201.1 aldehyde:ferredoxin oxidoreductase [Desulfosoma caldarium]
MAQWVGSCDRVLEVNVSRRTTRVFNISKEDRRRYLGGKGLALRYLAHRLRPGTDPLGPDNVLAVFGGVVVGSGAPCSARFSAVTKSPLTQLVASSSCGGPFGIALKTAGYEGLIVLGQASKPMVLEILEDDVRFLDADHLWGRDIPATQEALELGRKDGDLVIGPAGENLVLFANIASGHRFLGRGGFGAVLGSKRIKAIVARGGAFHAVPADPLGFDKACRRATATIHRNRFTGHLYRNAGTASHVDLCQAGAILPIHNFQDGQDPRASQVSGWAMKERFGAKPSTCRPCTILCGHQGTFSDQQTRQWPEYETVGLLGTNLGLFDPETIAVWNAQCGRLGLDTISCGGVLGYVMEASEKGLITSPLRFGSPQGVAEAIDAMAFRKGFGDDMAQGVRRLAEKYGGTSFAMHVKGLELPAYDPRGSWGQGLAYAVANRGGCHLSATLFPLEVFLGFLKPRTPQAKAHFVRFFESLYAGINSLPTCLFTTYAYLLEAPIARLTPKPILAWTMRHLPALAVRLMDLRVFTRLFETMYGEKLSPREFLQAGDRIVVLERLLNAMEGVRRKDDTLPERILAEPRPCDTTARQEKRPWWRRFVAAGCPEPPGPAQNPPLLALDSMLDKYYTLRGYTRNGLPMAKTLRTLKVTVPFQDGFDIVPGRDTPKDKVVQIFFWILGRAMQSASRRDAVFRRQLASWPKGLTVLFKVLPYGPRTALRVDDAGKLRALGDTVSEREADLIIGFKNMDTAFRMLTAQLSTPDAFAQNRLSVVGDLAIAMQLTRLLDRVQCLLYPKWLAQRLVKRVPSMPTLEKWGKRAWLYLVGIPLGL